MPWPWLCPGASEPRVGLAYRLDSVTCRAVTLGHAALQAGPRVARGWLQGGSSAAQATAEAAVLSGHVEGGARCMHKVAYAQSN